MTFDAQKALLSRVVLLSGDEDALRRRALRELLSSDAVDEFDLEHHKGGESTPGAWLGSAATAPFLGTRRVVVVRNVLRVDDPAEALAKESVSLEGLPETALLILVADEELGDENRQRKLGTIRKAWEKLVSTGKGAVFAFQSDPKSVRSAIKEEAKRLGKTVTEPAIDMLAEMTGGNLSLALEELEKLALFVGEEHQIREADIRELVIPSREWSVFALVDAVVAGDAAKALRQLRIVMGSAAKAEETAFRSVLPMLSRQFRLLWQARILVERKLDPSNAPAEVIALFPDRPKLSSERDFVQRRAMQAARQTGFAQLAACLAELSDCDARLKGLLPYFTAEEALEQMVLRMIDAMTPVRR